MDVDPTECIDCIVGHRLRGGDLADCEVNMRWYYEFYYMRLKPIWRGIRAWLKGDVYEAMIYFRGGML